MKDVLLKTEEKAILVVKFKELTELCSSVLWKVEPASQNIEYLVETISKQNVEGGGLAPTDCL